MSTDSQLRFDQLLVEKTYYPAGLHMPHHVDELSRISIVLAGESREVSDQGLKILPAAALLTKPNDAFHATTFGPQGCTILSVQFPDESLFPASCRRWAGYQHPGLTILGLQLWLALKKARHDQAVYAALSQLTSTVEALSGQPRPPASMAGAAAALACPAEERKSVQGLADELVLHRAYLSRAFKKEYLVAPAAYAKQHRLLLALEQLSRQGSCLAAVAYEAGYADQSHLSRNIRQQFDCTPGELRRCLA
jgi:AraC family transcriptional regulator